MTFKIEKAELTQEDGQKVRRVLVLFKTFFIVPSKCICLEKISLFAKRIILATRVTIIILRFWREKSRHFCDL